MVMLKKRCTVGSAIGSFMFILNFPCACTLSHFSLDCSPPGSSVHGIVQERALEWVAVCLPGDLPDPGIEPRSHALQADSLQSEPPGKQTTTKKQKQCEGY